MSGKVRDWPGAEEQEEEEEAAAAELMPAPQVGPGAAGAARGPRGSRGAGSDGPIFCLVCSMASMGPEGSVFIQPCRCGYWVHDQCLINVALQFEDVNPDTRSIGCKVCRRAYNILPLKGLVLRYATKFTNVWYQEFCYTVMETLAELVADIVFVKLGKGVLIMIYGNAEAARVISSMRPLPAIFTCQLIPVASLVISNTPWEQDCLDLLRSCSSLPVVGGAFPMLFREADIFRRSNWTIVGGLLLPFYALIVGKLFKYFVKDSLRQFLLGGATVILLKGLCKMYYKQKKYVHFCTFTIADAVPRTAQ